jgi:hypothetical protein
MAKHEWVDEPVQIYGGIPMNPSYMDGLNKCDRHGNRLTYLQLASLEKFRARQRAEWICTRLLMIDDLDYKEI